MGGDWGDYCHLTESNDSYNVVGLNDQWSLYQESYEGGLSTVVIPDELTMLANFLGEVRCRFDFFHSMILFFRR